MAKWQARLWAGHFGLGSQVSEESKNQSRTRGRGGVETGMSQESISERDYTTFKHSKITFPIRDGIVLRGLFVPAC